jgi:hypothetical protein
MKENILKITAILLILTGTVACVMISCKKENNAQEQVCNVDNPLTDLEWLRQRVAGFASNPLTHIRISQCTYGTNETGFLIEPCVGCPDFGCELVNCEGSLLCVLWGLVGSDCGEFHVDFENKKLIWEINSK